MDTTDPAPAARDRLADVRIAALLGLLLLGLFWWTGAVALANGAWSEDALRLWANARATAAWGSAPSVPPAIFLAPLSSWIALGIARIAGSQLVWLSGLAALLAGLLGSSLYLAARRSGAGRIVALLVPLALFANPFTLRAAGDPALAIVPAALFAALIGTLCHLERLPSKRGTRTAALLLLLITVSDPEAPYALAGTLLLLPLVFRELGSMRRRGPVLAALVAPSLAAMALSIGLAAKVGGSSRSENFPDAFGRWLQPLHAVPGIARRAPWPLSVTEFSRDGVLLMVPAIGLALAVGALVWLFLARPRLQSPATCALALVAPSLHGFEATAFEHMTEPRVWLLPLLLGVATWSARQPFSRAGRALTTLALAAFAIGAWSIGGEWCGPDERAWRTALRREETGAFAREVRSLVLESDRASVVGVDERLASPLIALTRQIGHVLPLRTLTDAGLAPGDLSPPQTIVVLNPLAAAGRADRLHQLFPQIWERGLAGYRRISDGPYWRIYRRGDPPAATI